MARKCLTRLRMPHRVPNLLPRLLSPERTPNVRLLTTLLLRLLCLAYIYFYSLLFHFNATTSITRTDACSSLQQHSSNVLDHELARHRLHFQAWNLLYAVDAINQRQTNHSTTPDNSLMKWAITHLASWANLTAIHSL